MEVIVAKNKGKRRRQIAQAESDGSVIAEYNRQLEGVLRQLEKEVPNCTDAIEKESGRALIRRLKMEIGEDFKEEV